MKISAFTKTYDGVRVLDCPKLSLEKGKIYSIIGANGSGKSTFAKILSGVLPADKRGKLFDGALTVGYMPQKNYAFRMSTISNILLGGGETSRAEELMDFLQIRHLEKKRGDKLSGGETARMALARLMMKTFDVVILDEPTAAMDVETTTLAEDLIMKYVQETGCTLILVTHSLHQAKRVSDEVLFFRKGQLIEMDSAEKLLKNPEKEETKQFLEFYSV